MTARVLRLAAPVAVLLLALGRLVLGDPFGRPSAERPSDDGPTERPAPRSAQTRAALGGLAVGDELAGFEVTRIGAPEDGQIVVELRDGERGARAWVTGRGPRGHDPADGADAVGVYYGPPPPGLEPASDEASAAVVEALRERIEAADAATDGARRR